MKNLITLALILAVAVTVEAKSKKQKQIEAALRLTPEHFKVTATVKDDSLDTVARITTVNGFQEKRGLLGIVWDDNFLRVHIDKATGMRSFQLYQIINYQGDGWNFYERVNYETPSGPQSSPVTSISRDVDCTFSRYGGCEYQEHIAFEIDEALLRTIAARYSPGQRGGWQFKFLAQSGREYRDGMLAAEVSGLLEKVDEYLVRNNLMGTNAVDEEETPLPPKRILPKPPTTIEAPAVILASLAEVLSTATPANGSTLHPSIKGDGAYITVNMVVIRGRGYKIALGRELAPVVKLIYESIEALGVVNWIVEVPYEDSYGNQGSRLLATFETSRFRVDMINWDRFKDRNLVEVVEKLNWIPER